jgi:predicted phosphodiesterase
MRIAVLYDVHGNLPALEAVIAEARAEGVDRVVVGGDVLPGPMPREAMDLLLDLDIPTLFIRGNGDREVLAAMHGDTSPTLPESVREVIRWNARQLGPRHERALASWPGTLRLPLGDSGEDVLFCHATVRNDTDIFTRRTPDARVAQLFEGVGAGLVVCGHTHMQFDRMVGATRIVNAGSVGMPFGPPGAWWLLLDPDARLRHTTYDLEDAAARIRATAYPQAATFAEDNILRPPSEEAMLGAFARAEPA